VVKEYRKLLEPAKAQPDFGTLEGFISAKVMVEGLRRAGRKLDRESFLRAMDSMGDYDAGGSKVSYGPDNHSGSSFVDLTIVSKDQKFVR
jgi:ABC-type branched-subunit amino acid transport system substrate-binding protein